MDSAMQAINGLLLAIIAAMLAGCGGVGCLYQETGKVVGVREDSRPGPERVVEVVGDSLRPLGFSGHEAYKLKQRPELNWDYEFSVGVGKFFPRDRVDVNIRFADFSILLSDFSRKSKASAFDRSVMDAIQTRLRSELDADISFTHPPTPALCLGP